MPESVVLPFLAPLAALALLEAVLSADNAVALAGIVGGITAEEERRRVLDRGLLLAFGLRVLMLLAAGWVLRFEAVRLLGGAYLIWMALGFFQARLAAAENGDPAAELTGGTASGNGLLLQIAFTDLAFSIDSVSAAVAFTDVLPLAIAGGGLGVLMLRVLAGRVVGWMQSHPRLPDAAHLTVLAVGLRMVARSTLPALAPSEGALLLLTAALFAWGLSRSASLET